MGKPLISLEAFADAVIRLLQQPAERQKLGETGAAYIKANYDWTVIAPKLLAVYDDLMDKPTARKNSYA